MNDDIISGYDAVTAADIADFTHYLAQLRFGQPRADDPSARSSWPARPTSSSGSPPSTPAPTPATPNTSSISPSMRMPPPSRPPSTSRYSRWGQLTGELEPVSAHPVGPDQRRTPGPVPGIWPTFRDRC